MKFLLMPAFVGLAVAVAVAGCGGSDDDDGEAAPTAGESPTSVADDPSNGDADDENGSGAVDDGGDSRFVVAALLPGDCFNTEFDARDQPDLSTVTAVDCDEPHYHEVVRAGVLRGDNGGDEWPGRFALQDTARQVCASSTYEDYLDVPPFGPGSQGVPAFLTIRWTLPSEEAWDSGARTIVCYVSSKPPALLSGSVEGVGYDVVPAGFPADAPRPQDISPVRAGTSDDVPASFFLSRIRNAGMDTDGIWIAEFAVVGRDSPDEAKAELMDAIDASGWTMDEVFGAEETESRFLLILEKGGTQIAISGQSGPRLGYYYHPE